jgi:hypothetical protein
MRHGAATPSAQRGAVLATLFILLILAGIAAALGYRWLKNNYQAPRGDPRHEPARRAHPS